METTYQILVIDGTKEYVVRGDGWTIPLDPANTDYQEYLKWLAEGNEPLPADDPMEE
jgi:hypothetical protein